MRNFRIRHPKWMSLQRGLRKFGLTLDQYHAKQESQDFACYICGDDSGVLCLDHNHVTNTIRKLLCNPCNKALGYFKDDPQLVRAAAAYLERW